MGNECVGSCLCGNVTYKVEGNFESFFLCHCRYCQKDTGSAHAANLFSTSAELIWVSGEKSVITFNLKDTRHTKSFCVHCGSALPSIQNQGKLLVVPAGSLDNPFKMKPNAHLFSASRAMWDHELEKIESFEGYPLKKSDS